MHKFRHVNLLSKYTYVIFYYSIRSSSTPSETIRSEASKLIMIVPPACCSPRLSSHKIAVLTSTSYLEVDYDIARTYDLKVGRA